MNNIQKLEANFQLLITLLRIALSRDITLSMLHRLYANLHCYESLKVDASYGASLHGLSALWAGSHGSKMSSYNHDMGQSKGERLEQLKISRAP